MAIWTNQTVSKNIYKFFDIHSLQNYISFKRFGEAEGLILIAIRCLKLAGTQH